MYNKSAKNISALILSCVIALTACSKSVSPESPVNQANVRVTGAMDAVKSVVHVTTESALPVRPSGLLAVYVSIALADGSVIPVTAAIAGVEALLAMHDRPTDTQIDSLYALLDEFGAVLVVDIPDMLNRSPERAQALDAYVRGLENVTERARRRQTGIGDDVATLKAEVKDQKTVVKVLDKEVKEAAKVNDFSTVGAKRQELTTEQATLSTLESQLEETMDLQSQFQSLIELADERLAAVNQNREALIAGIRVTDMPGIDELGVIQGKSKRGRSSTRGGGALQPFGGL